jgi:hypothetical protein
MDLNPGKGVRAPLDAGLAQWLLSVHGQINQAFEYAMQKALQRGTSSQESLQDDLFGFLMNSSTAGWEKESDQYGEKASIGIATSPKDTLYITVIITLSGKIAIDYRNWYVKG